VHVYNRNADKAETLVADGAILCPTPKEVAEQSEILMLCVTNQQAVEQLLFGEAGVVEAQSLPKIVVDFSTIPPRSAKEFSSKLIEKQVRFVDAPVSGGDIGAAKGTLTIMAGGASQDISFLRPVFELLGKNIVHTGPVGSGQLTKSVNQLVIGISVAAMTEGLLLARESGLDLSTTLKVLTGGAANSWSLENYAPRILEGDLEPGFYAKDMLKDLRIALGVADGLGVSLPAGGLVKELYTGLCADSDSEIGNHALIKLYDRMLSR
jgi:3-hydroxyisobutyrate dehydrogenase